jgi:hypothetical protein
VGFSITFRGTSVYSFFYTRHRLLVEGTAQEMIEWLHCAMLALRHAMLLFP